MVACWREALLAQKVLKGETKGYKHHPQLNRFRNGKNKGEQLKAIAYYLYFLYEEACNRGYRFNKSKIGIPIEELFPTNATTTIITTESEEESNYEEERKGRKSRITTSTSTSTNETVSSVSINSNTIPKITVNSKQVQYEFKWLLKKVKQRDENWYEKIKHVDRDNLEVHPLFEQIEGEIEEWEKIQSEDEEEDTDEEDE
ncbi:hypothetical protein ABK040_009018 [Willaertia magna]